jgi:hypothetical protein
MAFQPVAAIGTDFEFISPHDLCMATRVTTQSQPGARSRPVLIAASREEMLSAQYQAPSSMRIMNEISNGLTWVLWVDENFSSET